jgi:hypothetical protein
MQVRSVRNKDMLIRSIRFVKYGGQECQVCEICWSRVSGMWNMLVYECRVFGICRSRMSGMWIC